MFDSSVVFEIKSKSNVRMISTEIMMMLLLLVIIECINLKHIMIDVKQGGGVHYNHHFVSEIISSNKYIYYILIFDYISCTI